mgnify:CR=1 FL=1
MHCYAYIVYGDESSAFNVSKLCTRILISEMVKKHVSYSFMETQITSNYVGNNPQQARKNCMEVNSLQQ